jgi:hypothetical protein
MARITDLGDDDFAAIAARFELGDVRNWKVVEAGRD